MNRIGRRIYYDKTTGNIILDKGEMMGSVVSTTMEQDIATYTALSERNSDTFNNIELEYGQLAQNFAECNGYWVDVELLATLSNDERWKAIKFSYPDPNEPEKPPVYQKPLTEQINENTDYLVDVDYRLSLVELGLNQ